MEQDCGAFSGCGSRLRFRGASSWCTSILRGESRPPARICPCEAPLEWTRTNRQIASAVENSIRIECYLPLKKNGSTAYRVCIPIADIHCIVFAIRKSRKVRAIQAPGIGGIMQFRIISFHREPAYYPDGITGSPPEPWSILNDPGTNTNNGMNTGAAEPIADFTSVFGYDAFHPDTTFHKSGANTSGVVFFAGSAGLYVNGKIAAGSASAATALKKTTLSPPAASLASARPAFCRRINTCSATCACRTRTSTATRPAEQHSTAHQHRTQG
jgi:hypothetical protein